MFNQIVLFVKLNWGSILIIAALVAKILNKVTSHYSYKKGLVRFLYMLIDILDVVKITPTTVDRRKTPPPPPGPGAAITALVFVALLSSCSWLQTTPETNPGKFTPRHALNMACAVAPAAMNIYQTVCDTFDGEKKKKCLEDAKIASHATNAILNIATAVYGACAK
jgi:hypothetical protein